MQGVPEVGRTVTGDAVMWWIIGALVVAQVLCLVICLKAASSCYGEPPWSDVNWRDWDRINRRLNFLEEYVAAMAEDRLSKDDRQPLEKLGLNQASQETLIAMYPWRES